MMKAERNPAPSLAAIDAACESESSNESSLVTSGCRTHHHSTAGDDARRRSAPKPTNRPFIEAKQLPESGACYGLTYMLTSSARPQPQRVLCVTHHMPACLCPLQQATLIVALPCNRWTSSYFDKATFLTSSGSAWAAVASS